MFWLVASIYCMAEWICDGHLFGRINFYLTEIEREGRRQNREDILLALNTHYFDRKRLENLENIGEVNEDNLPGI